MLRQVLQKILKALSVAALRRHKSQIIAVTGTVGKTSTKEAIAMVLSEIFSVRKSEENYNNEIGVPLAILGVESGKSSLVGWGTALARGFWNTFFARHYPQVLVLEFGVDKPGDMAYLTDFVKLDYAVITALGEIPVHVEFFKNREALWEEKLAIAGGLKKDGVLFYNADDPELAKRASAKAGQAIAYGKSENSHIRLEHVENTKTPDGHFFGLQCTVAAAGSPMLLELPFLLGEHQLSAPLAAISIALAFEMPPLQIAKTLHEYEPPPGRMKLLRGLKQSLIIDDTYNASPASVLAALETLKGFSGHRRIAILGDMTELGSLSDEAHRQIGRAVCACADIFFAVGRHMALAAEEAKKAGMQGVRTFAFSPEAGKPLEWELKPRDVALVKGSQALRMEKIVEEIMAEPERAGELLVRQDDYWRTKAVEPP